MSKIKDKQKIELIRDMMGNSDYDETLGTIESDLLRQIYRIVHPSPDCPHPNWEKETKDLITEITSQKTRKNKDD